MIKKTETTPAEVASADKPDRPSKINIVTDLLRREDGATLDEMVATTGWQPHSTRAVLTGLRKKGHSITKSKREDVTCYRILDAI